MLRAALRLMVLRMKKKSKSLLLTRKKRLIRQSKYNMIRKSHFGKYGGRYVPEALIPALEELERVYFAAKKDKIFQNEFIDLLKNFSGRPTPLVFASSLT